MTDRVEIIYDGECPFCRRFVQMARLREAGYDVRLRNAREFPELVQQMSDLGYDLDEGMLVKRGDSKLMFGADAAHFLAISSSNSSLANRLVKWLLGSKRRAALIYPVLKVGRTMVLTMLRRAPLKPRR